MRILILLALTLLAPWAAGEAQPARGELVQVLGLGPDRLGILRARYDFWGRDPETGGAVFYLDAATSAWLEAQGLALRPDPRRQRQLDAWTRIDRSAWRQGSPGTIPGFACYRTVTRTHADLEALALAHPDRAEWRTIGQSWQASGGSVPGDDIHALVITRTGSPYPRAPLVVMAAQHARELATAEIATRLAELILNNPDQDPDLAWLADHREIHVIAQQNPDGRRQVEAGSSMWRKNYNETACPGSTPGVDLNRNSPRFWGDFSSGNSCSETYRGPVPASEPETQAVQNYLDTVFVPQRPGGGLDDPAPPDAEGVFISLHSFGQMVLLPWEGLGGGNENNAPNHDALSILGRRFGYLTGYDVARWQLLGPAGGTMVDYAYGEFGVPAYTFEVGTSFFESCNDFENVVWPAVRDALIFAAKAARRPYLSPAGPEITALGAVSTASGIRLTGRADDTRFHRGAVSEPPASDPVGAVVEIRVSLGAPEATGAQTLTFTPLTTTSVADFDLMLPLSLSWPANGRLFVTAVDDQGQIGVPRVIGLATPLFSDGFES
ncbi:MAG: hypothetical protein Kow0020_09460 [Wenzhouxiangellaceae bacterium]